jgi:protein TonB
VNQRRSSFTLISITVHAIIVAIVLIVPLFASLPTPKLFAPGLAWAPERIVSPVDIPLPVPARTRATGPGDHSPSTAQLPSVPAPIEPRSGIGPESGLESVADGTKGRVAAVERANGSPGIDGVGIAETAPSAPAAPRVPVRPSSGVRAPRKTVDVAPKYPALARESRVEGVVILEVIIDERGNVTSTRVLRSVTLLDQAAIDAVQQWKFTPTLLNGEPIPIVMTVTVSFRLQ